MKKEFGKYELVEELMINCYGGGLDEYVEEVMNDFYESFEKGKDVSKKDYIEFCDKYVDDVSEGYYIRKNWEYIMSGGDMSVYDEK